jgi:hypothetical protein
MTRPVWLAVIFLIGSCALAALKVSIASPSKQQAALADDGIEVSENALAKADKLDVEEPPDKKIIRSIAIIPAEAAPKAKAIISRHWQNGYAKAKTRKHYVSRKKHRRAEGEEMNGREPEPSRQPTPPDQHTASSKRAAVSPS